ncbi:hypothetical protein PGT21_003947 [Puccinia graminis f. sp. tritici]|uniref:Uncharacterized protein n=2 Tax=Puccinia graminis f. sp. tritici TaxID=56615 RepID=E3JTU6_PUCGT|nr:uncharacterized protein PGTG_00759 [Puccinia graminis f. sp. tritici CRL 75-36-700-3]EFP75428.1 hypothetical protein PGTG_00759 [Puccinia graminis f. sp. tritici CRL 75-36-700-3]KAA1116188.1 hypothetical protein PGT21_003947 [Puccinia graminis f. sp. tritici]KAA1130433.1 hypothetical protein PGTUg99_018375 [Puccinia graminis f. sp. tritici]
MQIRQLITLLGLSLSQTRPGAAAPTSPESIKSLVLDITEPHVPVKGSTTSSKFNDAIHIDLHAGPTKAIKNYDRIFEPSKGKKVEEFADSRAAYDDTLRDENLKNYPAKMERRLELYRNDMFSRMMDAKLTDEEVKTIHSGVKETLEQNINSRTEDFMWDNKHFAAGKSVKAQVKLEYMTREKIVEELANTNLPDISTPRPLTGEALKGFRQFMKSHETALLNPNGPKLVGPTPVIR